MVMDEREKGRGGRGKRGIRGEGREREEGMREGGRAGKVEEERE